MIRKYIITYDLNRPGQDYESLINAIKTYSYIKALKSAFFVKTSRSATEIYNHLRPLIDDTDRIFISEITPNHSGWLDKAVIDWLNQD
jgi:hypothetical protein